MSTIDARLAAAHAVHGYRTPGSPGERLGERVASFGRSKLAMARSVVVIGVLFGFGLVAFSPLASMPDTASVDHAGVLVVCMLVGGAAWIAMLGAAMLLVSGRGERIDLHEQGLVHRTRRRQAVVAFDDVAEIRKTRHELGWLDQCVVVGKDGTRVVMTDRLALYRRACDAVVSEVARRQVARLLGELRANRTVPFGPFVATKEGLSHEGRQIPWSEVAGVVVGANFIAVADVAGGVKLLKGRVVAWAKERYEDVPNAAVFAEVVEQHRRTPTSDPARSGNDNRGSGPLAADAG